MDRVPSLYSCQNLCSFIWLLTADFLCARRTLSSLSRRVLDEVAAVERNGCLRVDRPQQPSSSSPPSRPSNGFREVLPSSTSTSVCGAGREVTATGTFSRLCTSSGSTDVVHRRRRSTTSSSATVPVDRRRCRRRRGTGDSDGRPRSFDDDDDDDAGESATCGDHLPPGGYLRRYP